MDPTKPSLSSKSANINNGAGQNDVAPLEEAAEQWREGGGEVERPREVEREAKVTNGVTPAAETASQHQGAADKHRSNTISYQRRTKQKVVTDFATVSKGMSASAKSRGALRQVLFNQGVSDKGPVPEERGQLDALKQALEAFPVPVSLRWGWGEEGGGATLEDSWTDIVHSHTTMCKTQKHQQEALWEFVHTELTYINKLTIVTELVMSSLTNLHQHGFLQEVTSEQLFSNLPSILLAHQLFWREVMYPMLQEVRRTGKPFDPLRLEAGCLQFHERFSTYLQYCWEEENTVEFTHRLLDTNLHFHTYIQWVETHPQCERMRLGDMQAKPHQRITKYPLLLKAVHKNTQDPHTEHTLRGMLTSVNGFLDSINDYLRLKDEELALSISAQRVEGYYATDGMNEEIDKHVREFCHFDLTRPIRGVGPRVIRKLLLEETLKIRCRKDSKLEVMALLFSDVLLVTKAQKKAERLKVVRPPLALDRTRCAVLKDGCSFVLVEVSDLGCAMNVYTFSTSSPENCSKWVSAIQEAQETLQALSRTETSRQLKANQRLSQSEVPPLSEPKVTNEETVEQPDESQIETLLASIATEADLQTQEPLKKKGCFFQGPQYKFSDTHSQLLNRTYSHWPIKNGREGKAMDGVKMSGVGVRDDINQWEENYGTEFLGINERRVTWNQSRHSVPDISNSYISTGNTASTFKPKHHSLLLGGYPDIDYPFTQSSTNLSPCRENHPEGSMGQSEFQGFPGAVRRTMRQDSDSQSVEQGSTTDSWYSQLREDEALAEAQKFSRKLKSPRLRRRRPIHTQQDATPQILRRGSVDSGVAWSIPYTNSSSNSDSDCNQKLRGNSRSKGQSNDSHLVLKLGSLKMNRGVLWNISAEKVSPDPHTFSEPELPKEVPDKKSPKRPKLKTQRSMSIPDIIIQGGHGALLTPSRPSRAGIAPSPPPGLDRQLYPSPLEGLLERAKDRRRDRYGGNLEGREKTPNFQPTDLLHSPFDSTTLSQPPSKGDRERRKEVQGFRCRAPTVSEGWREAWVDGDEEKKTSFPFPDGASVDWPGWCFDDNEVMDRLIPEDSGGRDEGLWEGLSRSLTLRDFQRVAHQEDGQCSQV